MRSARACPLPGFRREARTVGKRNEVRGGHIARHGGAARKSHDLGKLAHGPTSRRRRAANLVAVVAVVMVV
jgi:hypothetical protein